MSEPESGALRVRPTYPQTEVTPIGIYAPTYARTCVTTDVHICVHICIRARPRRRERRSCVSGTRRR